jgi:hypothetical protein
MRSNLSTMISSEVQRTLVKSPPELWAELSDPDALARHLGELGQIRIVRTEPESTVEWAAEGATGTVSIKASGWGTKVTLSVTRETAEPEPTGTPELEAPATVEPEEQALPEPEPSAKLAAESEPAISDAEPSARAEPDMEPVQDMEPVHEREPEAAPRRGFFARLFGRRRAVRQQPVLAVEASTEQGSADEPEQSAQHEQSVQPAQSAPPGQSAPPEPGQPDVFAAVAQALEPVAFAEAHPFAVLPAVVKPASDISAELMAAESIAAEEVSAEEVTVEEVTAVLTAVLDRLGAAHHRPFSRS